MATARKVKHVVADSGAFIRNAPLRNIGVQIYTIPDVVAEIKDKATKQRLQFLPYQLEYKEATPEAVQIVTEFSKKTGDYPSLSATDIKVLAVAYQLEKEYVGTKHIKTTPDTKIEINLSTPTPSEPTQIAGFYLGSQDTGSSRTTSESVNSETSDGVDKVTSQFQQHTIKDCCETSDSVNHVTSELQRHTITDCLSEEACYSKTSNKFDNVETVEQNSQEESEVSGTKVISDQHKEEVCALKDEHDSEMSSPTGQALPAAGSGKQAWPAASSGKQAWPAAGPGKQAWPAAKTWPQVKIYSEMRDDSDSGGHVNRLTDEDEFPSLSHDSHEEPNTELSSQTGQAWTPTGSEPLVKIYSEMREDFDIGGHVNKLTDEDEFPTLSHETQLMNPDTLIPQQVHVEVCDQSDAEQGNDFSSDDFPSLSSSNVNNTTLQGWGLPKVQNEVKDESGIEDSHVGEEGDFPALSNTDYPSLSQNPIGHGIFDMEENQKTEPMLINQTEPSNSSVIRDVKPLSYARIIREGQAKVQTSPAVKRVFHEGQVLPSSIIGDEEEGESEDESEEDVDEGIEEEDEGEGWITPSNIKAVKKQMGLVDSEKAEVIVGCLTTDFAMQNVLIQMGLNVISVDGMLIKKAKSYVLRCFACFKITSKMEKLFCPHCGNNTLKRIAMTVNDDGTIKYFFSRRKQLSTRGLRQSLPAPKGGKHAHNPLLVADQPLPHQRPSRKALQSMDVFDPDFIASESPFMKHDVTSRAAQLGIMRRGQGRGRQHHAGGKKNTGRRK